MNVTNITDYDNFTSNYNFTDNCANIENSIDIIIPTLILTLPCGLSFLCMMILLIDTLNKPLINKKRWKNFYTQSIRFGVL